MAVFTQVSLSELAPWLQKRGVAAHKCAAISEGIENTNYRICADDLRGNDGNDGFNNIARRRRDYVFTIFELWDMAQVRYYAALMQHFAACDLPIPAPVFAPEWWNDAKPCLLVPFVENDGWRDNPTAEECRKMGAMIARLHLASAKFAPQMPNPRGSDWRRAIFGKLRDNLPQQHLALAEEELKRDGMFCNMPLPFGACHCDLFRNNVLWNGNNIAAVIDFYFGGDDVLLFDLAVAACDWCFDGDGFDAIKLDALFDGYLHLRRFCPLERRMLADAFCVAALRFWLSRLYDIHFPRPARVLQAHDPKYFENILLAARGMRKQLGAVAAKQ